MHIINSLYKIQVVETILNICLFIQIVHVSGELLFVGNSLFPDSHDVMYVTVAKING